MTTRRRFIRNLSILGGSLATTLFSYAESKITRRICRTVSGTVDPEKLGITLIHEHILVDFSGAASYDPSRWDDSAVIEKVLPYLIELKNAGCKTLIDCTPNFLGRDVQLLRELSKQSGLYILTNTGYYGGSDPKFVPDHALTETADELSERWIKEANDGIDGTGILPGFMKISVNPGILSEISRKLIEAGGKAHLRTGLTIASHTGPAIAAFEEIEILQQLGVAPDAFIWVHAQNENDKQQYVRAAKLGSWVSLDGLNEDNVSEYVSMLVAQKRSGSLHRTLISHDAGWYDPGKPQGGDFRGYTTLFDKLVPALKSNGFTETDVMQLIRVNPKEAFTIRVRRNKTNR